MTIVGYRSRRCWWQVRENGQPGVYGYCPAPVVAWVFGRSWCDLHNPVNQMLGVALVVVTGKAA